LSTKFSNNVLDSTKAYCKVLTDPSEVEGLPSTALGLAAQTARTRGHPDATPEAGPWAITLDFPSYMPVMQHAKSRSLREELYRAFLSRVFALTALVETLVSKMMSLRCRLQAARWTTFPSWSPSSSSGRSAPIFWAIPIMLRWESSFDY
jgi:oligopeptidase A